MKHKKHSKPKAWQIQRGINRHGLSPEATMVSNYLLLRQGVYPATQWEILFNMTTFASTVLGYDSVLDFVLPLEKNSRRRTKDKAVITSACEELEVSLQKSGVCCERFMGWKTLQQRTVMRYIRFCRLLFQRPTRIILLLCSLFCLTPSRRPTQCLPDWKIFLLC